DSPMSYGVDTADILRTMARFVDQILKGANPGDLPVEQPTTFDLAINAKTARALGLTILQKLLLRADEAIQSVRFLARVNVRSWPISEIRVPRRCGATSRAVWQGPRAQATRRSQPKFTATASVPQGAAQARYSARDCRPCDGSTCYDDDVV